MIVNHQLHGYDYEYISCKKDIDSAQACILFLKIYALTNLRLVDFYNICTIYHVSQ